MKLLKFLLGAIALLAITACSDDPKTTADDENSKVEIEAPGELSYLSSLDLTSNEAKAVKGNNAFAWDFFARNNTGNARNAVVSPLSVTIAMTMLNNGTYEDSPVRAEILDVLGFSGMPMSEVNSAVMKLANRIIRLDKDVDLALANSLWIDYQQIFINPAYISLLKKDFAADAYPVLEASFVSDVNRWCDIKTNGMIDNLMPSDFKTPKMALINATYFKGIWGEKFGFDKGATKKGNFTNADKSVSQPEMMSQVMLFDSRKTDKLEVIALPFGNGNYNFYLVRPNDGVSVEDCQKSLSNGKWDAVMAGTPTSELLDLKMPKFDVCYNNSIKEILAEMGMVKAVKGKGDYYFACPAGLEVEKILHNARLRVNEDGAEAAGVTTIIPDPIEPEPDNGDERVEPRPFHLDHPFIYLITEKTTGTIIFIGCVNSL